MATTEYDLNNLTQDSNIERKQLQDISAEAARPIPDVASTEKGDNKRAQEKYAIFYSGADTHRWDSVSGSGDADYARALAQGLNQILPGAACYLRDLHTEKEVYTFIENYKSNNTPILHVLRNAPRIGSAFTTEGLQAFKKAGGKVIVTAVEFYKHRFARNGEECIKALIECMKLADEVIFLDEMDKDAALESLKTLAPEDADLKAKFTRAEVICVPPTVTVNLPSDVKRGNDIISFGMIRTGKGLAHIRKLAGLIKQTSNPVMKDKKILIVGSIMIDPTPTEISSEALGTRQNLARNQELYKLMYCLYPSKRVEIKEKIKGDTSDNKTLKELLKIYQEEERSGSLKPALPIELHIDVAEGALASLFARAKYSFLPPYRGATLRNTSISCSLAQAETGLVTLSHCDTITPPQLRKGGKYEKAMILMNNEEYGQSNEENLQYENDGYAAQIFAEILEREMNPKLNEETQKVAQQLMQERLSRTVVSLQHKAVYETVLSHSLFLDDKPLGNKDNDSKRKSEINKVKKQEKPLQVFVTAASKNPFDEMSGTGDIDYATAVAKGLNEETPYEAILIRGIHDEKDIFNFIETSKKSPYPILHLHLNFPGTGTAFSLEGLKAFKARGGKLVITAIEFAKYSSKNDYKETMLQYLSLADVVLFLDELDKKEALRASALMDESSADSKISHEQQLQQNKRFKKTLEEACIIPLIPSIPTCNVNHRPSGWEIISFGMIREGKGFAHLLKLAKLLKESENRSLASKKILVIGTVQEHPDSKNKELFRLMSAIYPDKKSEMENKNIKELKELLQAYQIQEKNGMLKPEIPMELHLDVPPEKLNELFNRCAYAFLPAYRGATLRNSSIVNALCNNFIIYSHKSQFTPACLLPGGEHEGAMVLMDSDDYGTETAGKPDENGYAFSVLQDIKKRIQDNKLNQNTTHRAIRLRESYFSDDVLFSPLTTAYRTAMNRNHPEYLTFLSWQAGYHAKRSYEKFQKIQGVDIEKQSEINFKNLTQRLKTVSGPQYSPEMRKFLLDKLCGQVLTSEEKRLFQTLLKMPWFVKHVTSNYQPIRRGMNRLMSLDQRERMSEEREKLNSHTPAAQGNTDNVFLSLNPGKDFETVRFLDAVNLEISGNIETLENSGTSVLKGMWSSGHIYAFMSEQEGEPVNILGTLYRVRYRKRINEGTKQEEWMKECVFIQPDGREVVQTIFKEDEIFVHPKIELAIALMTLEKIRMMGKDTWEKIMRVDAKTLQYLVQRIFHSGVFEVHKPAQFLLDTPGISVIKRKPKAYHSDSLDEEVMRPLIEAVLLGDIDRVLKALHEDLPLNTVVNMERGHYNLDLMSAAILGGHLKLVSELLDRGVDLHRRDVYILRGQDSKDNRIERILVNPLGFTAILANPENCRDLLKRILGDKLKAEPKIRSEMAMSIAELLIKRGSKFKQNAHITQPNAISDNDLWGILHYLRPPLPLIHLFLQAFQGKGNNSLLLEAVFLQSPALVEFFLKHGVEMNEASGRTESDLEENYFPSLSEKEELPKYTPLIAAIRLQDLRITELLIRYGANINQAYSSGSDGGRFWFNVALIRNTEHEDCSPLMMAIKTGNIEICRALLKAGADITHRSIQGQTAFSLAHAQNREDIVSLLKSYLKPKTHYPLHEAAQKSDWETCRVLMQHPGRDQELDNEGRSAYDINSDLLKQPFIPLARQRESYSSHVTQTRIIMMFRNVQGEKYFLVEKKVVFGSSDFNDFLPFTARIAESLTSKKIFDISSMQNFAKSEKDFVVREQGSLSAGIKESSIFYIDNIQTVEYGPEALEKALATANAEDVILIPGSVLQAHVAQERKRASELQYQGHTLSKTATHLLSCLAKQKEGETFTQEEQIELMRLYREERSLGHQLISLAKRGDFAGIEALMKKSALSIDSIIATTEDVPHAIFGTKLGELKKYYGTEDRAFLAAIHAGQSECAFQMLVKLNAKLYGFSGRMFQTVIESFIKSGHVGFLKYHIQKLKEQGQDVPQEMRYYLNYIFKHSKTEILMYLIENKLIINSPEDLIDKAAQYFSSDIIKILLPMVTDPRKIQHVFPSIMRDYESGHLDTNTRYYHAHLSQNEIQHKVIELCKLLVPEYLKELHTKHVVSTLFNWIRIAIEKGNVALIKELQEFLKIQHVFNLEDEFSGIAKQLKEKETLVFDFVGDLIDPKGKLSFVVPIVQKLTDSKIFDDSILFGKIEQMYQKKAPELLAMRKALQTGDIKTLKELFEQGYAINAELFLPETISLASYFSDKTFTETVAYTKPLQIALKAKQFDCVKLLVERGVDIKAITFENLKEMVEAGHAELLTLLHKKGCKFLTDDYNNWKLLKPAYKQLETLKALLVMKELWTINMNESGFHELLDFMIEKQDSSLLEIILSKLTLSPEKNMERDMARFKSWVFCDLLFKNFEPKNRWLFSSGTLEIDLPTIEEAKSKYMKNSNFYYQIAKTLLLSIDSSEIDAVKIGFLLHLWGMEHEKDITELYEIILKTSPVLQKPFFKEAYKAVSRKDLPESAVSWLEKHDIKKRLIELEAIILRFDQQRRQKDLDWWSRFLSSASDNKHNSKARFN